MQGQTIGLVGRDTTEQINGALLLGIIADSTCPADALIAAVSFEERLLSVFDDQLSLLSLLGLLKLN